MAIFLLSFDLDIKHKLVVAELNKVVLLPVLQYHVRAKAKIIKRYLPIYSAKMLSKLKFLSVGVLIAMGGSILSPPSSPHNACEALQIVPLSVGAWTLYKQMLVAQPLVTKSLTSSGIMGISDVVCQKVVAKATPVDERPSKLDSTRVLHVAITGAIWSGPVTHYWYIILEKMYAVIAKAASIQDPVIALIVKLILDSTIFSSVTITGYFTLRSLLEGSGLAGAKEKLTTRFLTTLFGAWKFWPMANAVNFWFVPFQFRVLYMNILSLFWTGWLTYVNSRKISVPKKD